MNAKLQPFFRHHSIIRAAACVITLGWLAWPGHVHATTLQLGFTAPTSVNESNRQVVLEWNAEPAKTYLVQSADDLGSGSTWKTEEPVVATQAGPVRWTAPGVLRDRKYYRLVLPQPEVFSVEPAFIDSSDTNALFYIAGQCLPTNGTVVVNGQNFTPVSVDSNGAWMAISLNGLTPGTPVIGNILVLDNASNIVATLPLQTPVLYGTEMTAELLQGPPDEPPASPTARLKTKTRSNQSNDRIAVSALEGDPLSEAAPIGEAAGLHIEPSTGELRCKTTDLAIPGRGLDFAWVRTYRSRTGPNSAQGTRWDFNYNVSLTPQPDGTALLCDGGGRCDTFYPNGTNGWFRDEFFLQIGDVDRDGAPDLVTFPDTGRWVFNPQVGSPAPGKLAQIIDRNGNTIALHYDAAGRLDQIVDDLGRTNTIAYNPVGLIASVTDFSGRVVKYEYDGNGDLTAVISPPVTGTPNGNDFPGGKTNRFTYTSGFANPAQNHLLLTTMDAKGQVKHEYVYQHNESNLDFLRCISVQRGTNPPMQFTYLPVTPTAKNDFAVTKTIVRDAVGNVWESFADSRQRCVRLLEYSGRAPNLTLPTTETANRPTGKLRADDPEYFETTLDWNPDSLCTRIVYPGGNSTEMVYERAFNQNASRSNRRHAGDLRVHREAACCDEDADGDGLGDTLVTTFEHDARFGSPAVDCRGLTGRGTVATGRIETGLVAVQGWDDTRKHRSAEGYIGNNCERANVLRPRPKGWDGTVKGSTNRRVISDRDSGRSKGFGFVISSTDPRGIVTTATYDSKGNRTRKLTNALGFASPEDETVVDALYNSHGQLTAVTNAPDANGFRRVDTFSYYSSGPQAGFPQSETCDATGLALTTTYEYDARGNPTNITDPRGNNIACVYNALDQCVSASTPPNTAYPFINWKVDLTYDENDNLIRCDEENRDAAGVLDVANPLWTTRFTYDALDRCVEVVDEVAEGGGLSSYTTNRYIYDANDKLTTVQSPLAVSGADPNNLTQFEYDERGLLFREISAPGTGLATTNQWDYDPNANTRVTKVDAFVLKMMAYDGFDRLASVTDAMSNIVLYAYDRNDNLISARVYAETNDVPGNAGNLRYHEWRWRYDAFDRCVEAQTEFFDPATQSPIGDGASVTTFSYAPNGQCLAVADDNNHTTRYAYDSLGRLASVTDPKTDIVSYTYDECGNVLSVTQTDRSDLNGAIQQFSVVNGYDRLHRLTRSVDNVGNTNLYEYDSRDNLVRHTDPRGIAAFFAYDGLGRRTLAIGDLDGDGIPELAADAQQSYAYDANSRLVAATDDNTNTTSYAYDSRDRLVETTYADGTHRSLIWSPRSNLVREHDANGTVISNSFDLLDRCVRRDITPGAGVAATTTFEVFAYDGLSRLVSASNNSTEVRFAYDSMGNGVRTTAGGVGALTTTFDGVGNPLSVTYPSGRLVAYTYDALDQVSSMSTSTGGLPLTGLNTFAYEGPGRLGRIARTNSVNSRYQWNGLLQPANAPGDFGWQQVSGINHQVAGGGTVIDRRAFSYDPNQNLTSRAQTLPFFTGGQTTTNVFTYDALDRLTGFDRLSGSLGSLTRIHNLDGNGNRLATISNGVFAPYLMDAAQPDPADFQVNQYTLTPFVVAPEQYDQNGNLIGRTTATAQWQFVYDYADRLVAVADLSGGFPVNFVTYSYDALGRRVGKVINPGAPGQVTFGYTIIWGEEVLEERENGTLRRTYAFPHVFDQKGRMVSTDTGNGTLLRTYAFPHVFDQKGRVVSTDTGSGTLLRTYAFPHVFDQKGRVMFTETGATLHFLCDELDNTLALADAAGNVVERYDYDDFGAPYFLSVDGFPTGESESAVGNHFLFGGLDWDAETGFYLGHSQGGNTGIPALYDPQLGRQINGGMPNRISMNVTVPKQTQGATFGDRLHASLQSAGGGGVGAAVSVHFNPKEIGLDKSVPWQKARKQDVYVWKLKKEEGGRHTPFHNKYRPQSRRFQTLSNASKTRHDTVKNSINNVR